MEQFFSCRVGRAGSRPHRRRPRRNQESPENFFFGLRRIASLAGTPEAGRQRTGSRPLEADFLISHPGHDLSGHPCQHPLLKGDTATVVVVARPGQLCDVERDRDNIRQRSNDYSSGAMGRRPDLSTLATANSGASEISCGPFQFPASRAAAPLTSRACRARA